MRNLIWSEKFRPKEFDELILPKKTRMAFKDFIKAKQIANVLLYGPPGSGKTTLGMILLRELAARTLILNASSEDRGIDTVRKKIKQFAGTKRIGKKLNIILLDECFAKGTSIKTANGNQPIEEIKIGDKIINITGIDVVNNITKTKVDLNRMVRVQFNNNNKIICSINHKFFTNRGWIEAKNLTSNDYLLSYSKEKQYEKRLCYKMSYLPSIFYSWSNNRKILSPMQVYTSLLQAMWHNIYKTLSVWKRTMFLHLSWSMEKSPSKQKSIKKNIKWSKEMDANSTGITTQARNTVTNERPQCQSAFKTGKNKSSRNKKIEWNIMDWQAWWQWAIYQITKTNILFPILAYGSSSENSLTSAHRDQNRVVQKKQISNIICNRHCSFRITNWNRNRRQETQIEKKYIARFKKDQKTTRVRVDNITFYKQGSNDQSFKSIIGDKEIDQGFVQFYDLKIHSHPSYIANSVLVHNSDGLTSDAQDALKNTIDTYHKNCRFILTCNQIDKVIDPIISRCILFEFDTLPIKKVIGFCEKILKTEKIKYNIKSIEKVIEAHYPDIRMVINSLQLFSIEGTLDVANLAIDLKQFEEYLLKGEITKLRHLWKRKVDFIFLFKYLFNEFIPNKIDNEIKAEASIVVAEYLNRNKGIADKEINFTACCLELMTLIDVDINFRKK